MKKQGNKEQSNKKTGRIRVLSPDYLFFDFIRITAAIPGLIWFRTKIIRESDASRVPKRGGALLISNHSTNFDPVYLMTGIWQRRHHFICAKEFFDTPARAFWFRSFHCIPVDRSNFSMESFRSITTQLERGALVSMFPEGHLNRDGGTASFHSGMVMMAMRSGVPVIPVYIKTRKNIFGRIRIAIGDPVDVKALYMKNPTLAGVEAIAGLLHDKEEYLAQICK